MKEKIVILGAGMAGLGAALAFADPNREITVIDRDPPLPNGDIEDAFKTWQRGGATQIRHSHVFLARLYNLIRDAYPELARDLMEAGARELRFADGLPHTLRDSYQPKAIDDDMSFLSSRRTTLEFVMRRFVERQGQVSFKTSSIVRSLKTRNENGTTVVSGVTVSAPHGEDEFDGDIIIDAMGRNSPGTEWLRKIGADITSDVTGAAILYYTRHYRFRPGQSEPPRGELSGTGDLGYLKFGVFPGDNDCFSITLAVPEVETEMRRVIIDPQVFDFICTQLPGVHAWTNTQRSEPTSRVFAMGNLANEWRHFVKDGVPQALNYFAIGDAAIRTNPLYGRGCSLGFWHAHLLANIFTETSEPIDRACRYDKALIDNVRPYFDAMARQDRSAAKRAENERDPDYTPSWRGNLMRSFVEDGINPTMRSDVNVLRAALSALHMLDHPEKWMLRPSVLSKILLTWAKPKALKKKYYTRGLGPNRRTMFDLLDGSDLVGTKLQNA